LALLRIGTRVSAAFQDFRVVGIETSSHCNRHCENCQRSHLPPTRFESSDRSRPIQKFLEEDLVYSLLEQLAAADYKGQVQMFSFNEPALDPRLSDFLEFGHKRGLKLRLTTNGDRFREDPDLMARILPYLAELRIGIYDYSLSHPDWPARRNTQIEFWQKLLAEQGHDGLNVKFSLREKFSQTQRLLDTGWSIQAPCPRVTDGIYVLYNGCVSHCCGDCYDSLVFGNVKSHSLAELLSSRERAFIVQALLKGERWRFAACRDCLQAVPEHAIACDVDVDRDACIQWLGRRYGLASYTRRDGGQQADARWYLENPQVQPEKHAPVTDKDSSCFPRNPFSPNHARALLCNDEHRHEFRLPPDHQHRKFHPEHFTLQEDCAARCGPGKPLLLLAGDRTFLQARNPWSYWSFYDRLNAQYNILHDPNTINTTRIAVKRTGEWILASPDRLILWFSPYNAKRSEKTGDLVIGHDHTRTSLEYVVWKLQAYLSCQIAIVSPPLRAVDEIASYAAGKPSRTDFAQAREVASDVAARTSIALLDIADTENWQQEAADAICQWLSR